MHALDDRLNGMNCQVQFPSAIYEVSNLSGDDYLCLGKGGDCQSGEELNNTNVKANK